MQKRLSLVLLALPMAVWAQEEQPPTTQAQRDTTTINVASDPLLRGFRWRSIGPVGQGGRVDDIAVDEKNTSTYYVGFATAGIWKTTNNGVTFTPDVRARHDCGLGSAALALDSRPAVIHSRGAAN
jgi:hypothetical protein